MWSIKVRSASLNWMNVAISYHPWDETPMTLEFFAFFTRHYQIIEYQTEVKNYAEEAGDRKNCQQIVRLGKQSIIVFIGVFSKKTCWGHGFFHASSRCV